MYQPRRRFKQTKYLQQRPPESASYARREAEIIPAGPRKQQMAKKARVAETTGGIEEWISSPGLAPPE